MPHQLHRATSICFGASGLFTFASFTELVSLQNLASVLAFIGSASFTAFSWYLSRKAEIHRIEREEAAEEAAFKRQQELEAVLHEIRLSKVRHDAGLPEEKPPA